MSSKNKSATRPPRIDTKTVNAKVSRTRTAVVTRPDRHITK
jgi:hypothetical protein